MFDVVTAPVTFAAHSDLTVIAPAGFAYNLPDLQAVAQVRFGFTRAQTLSIAQSLYERGMISYPRVEDRLLRMVQFEEAARLVRGYAMASGSREYDECYRSPGWVEELPGSHHGITLTTVALGSLFGVKVSDDEIRIYGLVHARILDMFKRPAA